VRKAVGTLVALLGTIAAAVGGFSLLGLIYASVGVDRHFEIRGWLATLGLGLLGTLLFVAGYWMRVDKAELRQLLTDQFYGPDAVLAPKGEGARPTTMWGAYLVWVAVFVIGYAIDGFVGLVVVGRRRRSPHRWIRTHAVRGHPYSIRSLKTSTIARSTGF